jgi:hypothetical protein
MTWRMSEHEFARRAIIRALRRDVPNGKNGWSCYIANLADKIESGEIIIELKGLEKTR